DGGAALELLSVDQRHLRVGEDDLAAAEEIAVQIDVDPGQQGAVGRVQLLSIHRDAAVGDGSDGGIGHVLWRTPWSGSVYPIFGSPVDGCGRLCAKARDAPLVLPDEARVDESRTAWLT